MNVINGLMLVGVSLGMTGFIVGLAMLAVRFPFVIMPVIVSIVLGVIFLIGAIG
jgi:hypothetical protein